MSARFIIVDAMVILTGAVLLWLGFREPDVWFIAAGIVNMIVAAAAALWVFRSSMNHVDSN